MQIREYKASDYVRVVEILKIAGLFDTTWDSEENLAGMQVFVMEQDSKVVACVYVTTFGAKVAWVFRLAVDPDFRGQGVATKLIDHITNHLKAKGYSEIGLFMDPDCQPSNNFYSKRGFTSSGKRWVYMHKPLTR
jgi:N-acetylglutamate synthase-like GNAT family acetyltransferase